MVQCGLVERDLELVAVRAACDDALAGRGGVLAVRGPAGIGKTALLGAARGVGVERRVTVLAASGAQLEQELAFGIVRQLFERTLHEMSEALRTEVMAGAAGLASGILLDRRADGRAETLEAGLHGLYWLAAELSARVPLLLVVDDLQWADAASLRWLAYLGRRLDGVALLIVVACRDGEPGADDELIERGMGESGARVLRPAPLSRDGVERWLIDAFGRPVDAALVDGCWQRTGGNPFLLRELASELRADATAGDARAAIQAVERATPATIAASVLMRLARAGRDATRVAESVAVLSQDARLDIVARLAGLALPEAGETVDRLTAVEILAHGEAIAFAHPVLRSAVYDQIPAVRRGLAHAVAARLLLDDGAPMERAATHVMLAPPAGDARVVEVLRAAAASAIAQGAPDAAAPLLRRALAEPARDVAEVLLELAVAEGLADDAAAIDHARAAIEHAPDPELRARAALVAADVLLRRGRPEEALSPLATIETDALDGALARTIQATALMVKAFIDATLLDDALTALGAGELEGNDAAERQLLMLRATDFTTRAVPREQSLSLARRVAARAEIAVSEHEIVLNSIARCIQLADHADEARAILTAIVESGRRRGVASAVAFACGSRADLEWFCPMKCVGSG